MEALVRFFQQLGPYLAMAIVVPGGLFIAPCLYFYRRQRVTTPGVRAIPGSR